MSEEEKKIRDNVRRLPQRMADDIFNNTEFQKTMNRWMLGTHIMWGFTLAVTFIGLNYTLIWLSPPAWIVSWTFTPIGIGYITWQWWRFRKPKQNTIEFKESST